MVMEEVPAATVDATVKVAVELPAPVIDAGLKPTVTPEGCPLALSETAESNPPETDMLMVEFPELPCATESDAGDADRLNDGEELDPVSAAMRPELGLPHPVT